MTAAFLADLMNGEHVHSLCSANGTGTFRCDGHYATAGELLAAADELTRQHRDVWFGVHGLKSRPDSGRGNDDDVAEVCCLPVDLDWKHLGAHADGGLPTEPEVRDRLARFAHKPSFIVETGHGLQPYWLLDAPVTPERGHELTLRLHAALLAAGLEPERDDLASVLRVPGTVNFETDPVDVRIVDAHPERRYQPEYLEKYLPSAESKRSSGRTGHWRRVDRDTLHPANLVALVALEALGGHDAFLGVKNGEETLYIIGPNSKADRSASIGYIGPGKVKVFTSSWKPLVQGRVYSLDELERIVNGDDEQHVEHDDDLGVAPDGHRLTDVGNSARLIAMGDGKLRFVHKWGKWLVYRRGRWVIDENNALTTEMAKRVARALLRLATTISDKEERQKVWAWAVRSESSGAIANMIHLARGVDGILTEHEDLDADPCLLNVRNGTIDLRTGELRPHDPDDLLTMQCPVAYDTDATAPLWKACLERWQPDADVRRYLQIRTGAGTTGIPTETVDIDVGPGGNGKSVFHGGAKHVLGDYATEPHKSLLVAQRHEQHATVVATMFRVRYAVASETSAGDRLDEASIKNLTGRDRMRARRMREDEWSFDPSHTLVVFSNHRPRITGTDHGIWRRVRFVPWETTITEPDRDLPAKLRDEASGILRWLVDGARQFLADEWKVPSAVTVATDQYRADEDTVARFIGECCRLGPGWYTYADQLRQRYEAWCRDEDVAPRAAQAVAEELKRRGVHRAPTGRKRWLGIGLLDDGENGS
jgi:putative DNA primase/helicase